MKYLLDTCVALWSLANDKRISKEIKDIVNDETNQIFYSTASTWEVELKHEKFSFFKLSGEQFAFLCDQNGIRNIPIDNKHINNLPKIIKTNEKIKHNDPFDKLLIAQAKTENMTIITSDEKFSLYDYKNIIYI